MTVARWDKVGGKALAKALDMWRVKHVKYAGNQLDLDDPWEDAASDIESGARIEVEGMTMAAFVMAASQRELTDVIIDDILEHNCHLDIEHLTGRHTRGHDRLTRNADGSVKQWDLSGLGLHRLPETFGHLIVDGDLKLNNNEFKHLPKSFGLIKVSGDLNLSDCLLHSLPENFGDLEVGGGLNLVHNHLTSLPASFHSIQVGNELNIEKGNQIHQVHLKGILKRTKAKAPANP